MFLTSVHLRQFRNYAEQTVDFSAPKTILVGENAQGKSNLLEAVELLSVLKSHRTSRDRDLVQDGHTSAQIAASVDRGAGPHRIKLTLRSNGRRTTVLNGETLRRQMDLLGTLNAVQFSSLDLELVRGGPAYRRDWLDGLLIQLEPFYAHLLHQYGRVLRQRNALLRQGLTRQGLSRQGSRQGTSSNPIPPAISPDTDPGTALAVWDAQLAALGTRLIRRRARALELLTPLAQNWHELISGQREELRILYRPSVAREEPGLWNQPEALQQEFFAKLGERAIAEQVNGTSLVGPHRDEIDFLINDTPARQYGSQGQQRTLVLALKLAELTLIHDVIGEPPLLLLDDVLAELDLNRQNQLLDVIQTRFQTLITTTHLSAFQSDWLKSSQILSVEAGRIVHT
jgi:DNA replication and repair protein RecF